MWFWIFAAIVLGAIAFIHGLKLSGFEAPVNTPESYFWGWGGITLFVCGVLAGVWQIVSMIYYVIIKMGRID